MQPFFSAVHQNLDGVLLGDGPAHAELDYLVGHIAHAQADLLRLGDLLGQALVGADVAAEAVHQADGLVVGKALQKGLQLIADGYMDEVSQESSLLTVTTFVVEALPSSGRATSMWPGSPLSLLRLFIKA
jgi:hypothetical protein